MTLSYHDKETAGSTISLPSPSSSSSSCFAIAPQSKGGRSRPCDPPGCNSFVPPATTSSINSSSGIRRHYLSTPSLQQPHQLHTLPPRRHDNSQSSTSLHFHIHQSCHHHHHRPHSSCSSFPPTAAAAVWESRSKPRGSSGRSSTALGNVSSMIGRPFTAATAATTSTTTTIMLPCLLLSFIAGGIFFSLVRNVVFGSSIPSSSSSSSSDGDEEVGSTSTSTPKTKKKKNRIHRIAVLSFLLIGNILRSVLLGIVGAPGRLLGRSVGAISRRTNDGRSPAPGGTTTTSRGWKRFRYYSKNESNNNVRKLSCKQLVGFQYVVDMMTPYVISRNFEVALKDTLQNIVQIDHHNTDDESDVIGDDDRHDDDTDTTNSSHNDREDPDSPTTNIIRNLTLTEFDIGPVPPKLTGARILLDDENEPNDDDDDDQDPADDSSTAAPPNMTFDVDVLWKSQLESRIDLVVERRFGGLEVPVVIRNVRFDGTVRVQFMPLLRNPPGFGAILVSFLHDPIIDADVEIYGGEVTNVPWVRSELLGAVRNGIREKFIWPQRLVLPARPPNINATVLEESDLLLLEKPGESEDS